jgi:uncharacterized lipoprotein NlpE involved in copper resistance
MKKYFSIVALVFILMGCNKHDFLSDLNFEKFLLSGSGNYHNTSHTWYLDSLTINGVNYNLNAAQKAFNMTFNSDGSYINSDGYYGKWEMPDITHLNITKRENNNNSINTSYILEDLNSIRFRINNVVNNTTYIYYYKIENQ